MTTAYLINNDSPRIIGRFKSIKAAEVAAEAGTYDFSVITDEEDITKLYTVTKMAEIFNQLTGQTIKKFRDKAEGAKRIMQAAQEKDFAGEAEAAAEKPKGPRLPREGTKMYDFYELYKSMRLGKQLPRRDVIAAGMEQVGLSKPHASTYYYNCQKLTKALDPDVEIV